MGTSDRDQRVEKELADLKREYERLREERVRTEQNLANVRQQLEELEAGAMRDYGTADPERLAALLEERRAENERMVREYGEHVRSVARGLEEAEARAAESAREDRGGNGEAG